MRTKGHAGSLAYLAAVATLAMLGANQTAWGQQKRAADKAKVEWGKALFEHEWVKNDPLSPMGDGLGPMFNAKSCVACHGQADVGGAGGVQHNVQLLTVTRPHAPKDETAKDFRAAYVERVGKLHANFLSADGVQSSVVFHRGGDGDDFQQWRESFWGVSPTLNGPPRGVALKLAQKKSAGKPVSTLPGRDGVEFVLSERNTPALFGAGLIDSIPDDVLIEVARQQAQQPTGIRGRVGRTNSGDIGRFGWRGQVNNLEEFVLTACAVELGLETANHQQTRNPRLGANVPVAAQTDLSVEQSEHLNYFVANLPRPEQETTTDPQRAALLNLGESMFHSVGCSACHVPKLGEVNGLFSDLLLHDMGPGLADPVPAFPEKVKVGTVSMGSVYAGSSFDVFAEVPTNLQREWRTPPLWGVADSAPYLHDGRTGTIEQAILLHGGEGQSSAARFASLPTESKNAVLLLLNSLRAPGQRGRRLAGAW